MEDYTYHFDPERSLVSGAHMLEICPSIASGPIHLEARPLTREHIEDFASMAGVELLCIGEGSTVEGIKNHIRWNEMYYHLAKGI